MSFPETGKSVRDGLGGERVTRVSQMCGAHRDLLGKGSRGWSLPGATGMFWPQFVREKYGRPLPTGSADCVSACTVSTLLWTLMSDKCHQKSVTVHDSALQRSGAVKCFSGSAAPGW